MRRERRFFVPDLDASPVELSPNEAYHLVHVLRLGQGDDVVLFDGKGHAANATVARVEGDIVVLDVGDSVSSNESPLALIMAIAVPKGDTMSLVVQKLTELGVHAIQPLLSENGEMRGDTVAKRIERWRRISLEAAKQCGRSRLPRIEAPKSFSELARDGALLLTPGAPPLPSSELVEPLVLVGPEGGWSAAELRLAKERELAVFGLGPRSMRTETAAIAAATLMQWLGGGLR